MTAPIQMAPLAEHPAALPFLAAAFEHEWPSWYGPGGLGQALADLQAYARLEGLPQGVVALQGHAVVGVAALKEQALEGHPGFTPTAGAGWVHPDWRGRGIGGQMLAALEALAGAQGIAMLYAATHRSASLFQRAGWEALEVVAHEGAPLHLFRKALKVPSPIDL
jgi:GNAT superfamily N-acetyltransferase